MRISKGLKNTETNISTLTIHNLRDPSEIGSSHTTRGRKLFIKLLIHLLLIVMAMILQREGFHLWKTFKSICLMIQGFEDKGIGRKEKSK